MIWLNTWTDWTKYRGTSGNKPVTSFFVRRFNCWTALSLRTFLWRHAPALCPQCEGNPVADNVTLSVLRLSSGPRRWATVSVSTVKFTGAGINRTAHMGGSASEMAPGITTSSVRFFFANPNQGLPDWFWCTVHWWTSVMNSDSYIYHKARVFRLLLSLHSGVSAPEADSAWLELSQIGSACRQQPSLCPIATRCPFVGAPVNRLAPARWTRWTPTFRLLPGGRHRPHRWRLQVCGVGWRRARGPVVPGGL